MLKSIMQSSYWLGMASFLAALVWKAFNLIGIRLPRSDAAFAYMTFYEGGILFLLVGLRRRTTPDLVRKNLRHESWGRRQPRGQIQHEGVQFRFIKTCLWPR